MCTLSVSNVIYHKFSHGAAFYTLNGKNVNVMLEFEISAKLAKINCKYGLFRVRQTSDCLIHGRFNMPCSSRIISEVTHLVQLFKTNDVGS